AIALVHRRSARKPASGGDVLLQLLVIIRVILLHHLLASRAAEVETVVCILLEQLEVSVKRCGDELADHLRVSPAPLRVEVCISDGVERLILRQGARVWIT